MDPAALMAMMNNNLKNIIKQASSMVPPPMKQMLPQNMQNVMKKVDQ